MKKQHIPYQKVDTAGEITAVVVASISEQSQTSISRSIMKTEKNVEQVAFVRVSDKGKLPSLRMMGGELSVNGTVAGAFTMMKRQNRTSLRLLVSELDAPVSIELQKNRITALFPPNLVTNIGDKEVVLAGMTYRLVKGIPKNRIVTEKQQLFLRFLAEKTPASGIIFYEKNSIQPVLYVKTTNSIVLEQACGSGSIAFALATGTTDIKQPSGQIISITKKNDRIMYQARVQFKDPCL